MIINCYLMLQVSLRPWVRLDGTFNRRVLDRLLASILGHMMLYPGITISSLTDRFSPGIFIFGQLLHLPATKRVSETKHPNLKHLY